jgi:N-acetylglucosaminyldiphosphoundecaprenol N-acetyl-beta-D-mannosaminyltransferase
MDSAQLTPAHVFIDGVRLHNLEKSQVIQLLKDIFGVRPPRPHGVFLVNAHTLNLAADHPDFHAVLRRADYVFGDGTGVRWAARLRGVRLRDNLVGTDLIPELFRSTSGKGFRYFLLGADATTIDRAADYCRKQFPGWELAGHHHGYVQDAVQSNAVIEQINAAQPHLLLVGMGNPLQEQWIDRYLDKLTVPVCVGVGGLFDHWGGNLRRAPRWVRRAGFEWLQLLLQQPGKKWRRYLLGNPKFLIRIVRTLTSDKAAMSRFAEQGHEYARTSK